MYTLSPPELQHAQVRYPFHECIWAQQQWLPPMTRAKHATANRLQNHLQLGHITWHHPHALSHTSTQRDVYEVSSSSNSTGGAALGTAPRRSIWLLGQHCWESARGGGRGCWGQEGVVGELGGLPRSQLSCLISVDVLPYGGTFQAHQRRHSHSCTRPFMRTPPPQPLAPGHP